MSLAIRYCWLCGLPLENPRGSGNKDTNLHHICYIPELIVQVHGYCHRWYHLTKYKSENVRDRYLRLLAVGRAHNPYSYSNIPWCFPDTRAHPEPMEEIELTEIEWLEMFGEEITEASS